MKRREFITLLDGTAAWPLAASAQQLNVPLVGFLHLGSPQARTQRLAAFRQGLADNGYIDGHNVTIEYRWAEEQYERLPGLAADLVQRQVAVNGLSRPRMGASGRADELWRECLGHISSGRRVCGAHS
jgi:putative ABC transport system substrate-binding protein